MTERELPPPRPSTAAMHARLAGEIALPSRLGYTTLLLASLGMVVGIGSLLVTEPVLPMRTRVAFSVIVFVGLAWAGFATWVLQRRRVLFASHRVIAAGFGVVFSALFTAGALTLWVGVSPSPPSAGAAAAAGAVMLVVALVLLRAARQRVHALRARIGELQRQVVEGAR